MKRRMLQAFLVLAGTGFLTGHAVSGNTVPVLQTYSIVCAMEPTISMPGSKLQTPEQVLPGEIQAKATDFTGDSVETDAPGEPLQEEAPVTAYDTPDTSCPVEPPEAEDTQETPDTQVPEVPAYTPPDFVLRGDGIPDSRVQSVISHYLKNPENVRTWFESNGWKICIKNNIGQAYCYDFPIQGLTDPGEHTVFIDNRKVAESAIIHETAHAVAYASQDIVYNTDFEGIWQAEMGSFAGFWSTHANNYNTPFEYFAEGYAACILNPSGMQEHCPGSYAYIMGYMNGL